MIWRYRFDDSPEGLRRLVLLLYALVGPVFTAALLVGRDPSAPRWPVAAIVVLIAAGATVLLLRRRPTTADWIFPAAIAPTVCCGLGVVSGGPLAMAYLGVMAAPLAWASILFDVPVAVAAFVTAAATCFASVASVHGVAAAAASTVVFSAINGLVGWVVFGVAALLRDTEERLRASLDRDRALLAAMPDTLARTDREGRFLDVHAPPGEDLPASPAALVGKSAFDFLPAEAAPRMREAIAAALASPSMVVVEYEAPYAGEVRHFESRIVRVSPEELLIVRRDVTALRRAVAEAQARLMRDVRLDRLESRINEVELVLRADGTVVHANDRALAAYGYGRDEILRLNVRDLRAPETRDLVAEEMKTVTGKGDTRFETTHVRKDGTRFPVEVSSRAFTAGGEVLLHSLVRDLSEQRQREEQLRLSAALVRHMQEAVVAIGTDLRIRSWLGAAESIYGFTEAEALGRPVHELVQPDLPAAEAAAFAARLAERGTLRAVVKQRRKDGTPIFVDASTAALRGPEGRISGYLAVVRDVTEQKHAERSLRRSEERLRLALAAGAHVAWEWDVGRDVFTHGPGWPEMLGTRPGEIPDTIEGWRSVVHPDDLPRAWQALQDCVQGRTDEYHAKYRMRAPGGWRWIRSQARAARRDATGRALRLVGTRTDVTETEDLNRRLFEATRLASVGTLASGVAHEINNPLAYLSSNLDQALERLGASAGGLDEATARDLRTLVAEAREGSDRIAGIVKAMRSLGRPERPDPASDVDVRGELLSAIQLVRNQLAQRARLEVDVPAALPPVRSRTSELGRVFLNLLVNAAQAIPEGAATDNRIGVTARTAGGQIVVEISDSGCGLSDEARARMFDAFYTTKPVGKGTGLGLTIAKSIVDAAGGHIEFEDRAPRGALFRVRLPAAHEQEDGETPPASAPAVPRTRRRVLVVDDEPLVRRSLERMVAREHEVASAGSGNEALRIIEADPRWDAILCDLMMPNGDGIALWESLAARHPALLPRVAFVTGGAFGERTSAFLAEHPVVVVPKPFDPELVLEVVQRLAAP